MTDLVLSIAGTIFIGYFLWRMAREWRRARTLGREYREATNVERAELEEQIAKNPDLANYMRPQPVGMVVWVVLSCLVGIGLVGRLFS